MRRVDGGATAARCVVLRPLEETGEQAPNLPFQPVFDNRENFVSCLQVVIAKNYLIKKHSPPCRPLCDLRIQVALKPCGPDPGRHYADAYGSLQLTQGDEETRIPEFDVHVTNDHPLRQREICKVLLQAE